MDLGSVREKEKAVSRANLKRFRFDLSTVFAVACLVIIILYLGSGIVLLLDVLETPLSHLISAFNDIGIDDARSVYRDFIRSGTFTACLDLVTYLLSLALPFLFALWFMHNRPESFYPVSARLPKDPGKFIFFTFGFTLSMNLVCNLLLSEYYPELTGSSPSGVVPTLITVIMTVIIAPIGEELIFRGVIFQTLLPYGTGFAVFASSLIFALAHRNPPQMINAFFFGICLAIGFCKTRSVTVCVLMHLVNNAFSVAVTYMINDDSDPMTYVIGIGILVVICFAISAVFNTLATGKSSILVCDDNENPTPRLTASQFALSLLSNFFFWFYLVIIAIGTVVLYI